mgnify:CR=1 FL=1
MRVAEVVSNDEFQSTRPRGARLDCAQSVCSLSSVSIHAPAWGATISIRQMRICFHCFNPRARVGRDAGDMVVQNQTSVSIHAPAWGATSDIDTQVANYAVSIHAPAWGATKKFDGILTEEWVSIHAPAWGATRGRLGVQGFSLCFNPRARVGRDRCLRPIKSPSRLFQSTRPRGARHLHSDIHHFSCWFQSTRPRGARQADLTVLVPDAEVSIHAPAWGATRRKFWYLTGKQFQSTRPRGARPDMSMAEDLVLWFQSTRPRGARHM